MAASAAQVEGLGQRSCIRVVSVAWRIHWTCNMSRQCSQEKKKWPITYRFVTQLCWSCELPRNTRKNPRWNFQIVKLNIQVSNCLWNRDGAMTSLLDFNVLGYPGMTGNGLVTKAAAWVHHFFDMTKKTVSNKRSGICYRCKRSRLSSSKQGSLSM